MEMFVVVTEGATTVEKLGASINGREIGPRMRTFTKSADVLRFVGEIGKDPGDPRTLKKVFTVSDEGELRNFKIVFEGRLMLVPNEEEQIKPEVKVNDGQYL